MNASLRNRSLPRLAAGVLLALGLTGLSACGNFPKNIQQFPEPWQTLEPGKPLDKVPATRVITLGNGRVIEPGDLVQINLRTKFGLPVATWQDDGFWWLWIGFRNREETPFFNEEKWLASAFVGHRQGSVIEFVDNGGQKRDRGIAGRLLAYPFGNHDYYSWRKPVGGKEFAYVYIASYSTPSTLEIKRVVKGPAQYRTVRLFDDSPVEKCVEFKCWITREPREMWIDEARFEGVSGDGRKVLFQYGPLPSMFKTGGRSPVIGFWDNWFEEAWDKLPVGVQFVGNRPPVAVDAEIKTARDTPLRIDIAALAKTPDKDKLSTRILWGGNHGKLERNADGTFTYTPNAGWQGIDTVTYKVSDGLVESPNVGRIEIWVDWRG